MATDLQFLAQLEQEYAHSHLRDDIPNLEQSVQALMHLTRHTINKVDRKGDS